MHKLFHVVVTYDAVTRYSATVAIQATDAATAKIRVDDLLKANTPFAYTALTSYSMPPEIEDII